MNLSIMIITSLSPQFVFATHGHFIPSNIFNQFEVVVHMTDLPFGRGGSLSKSYFTWAYHRH